MGGSFGHVTGMRRTAVLSDVPIVGDSLVKDMTNL